MIGANVGAREDVGTSDIAVGALDGEAVGASVSISYLQNEEMRAMGT